MPVEAYKIVVMGSTGCGKTTIGTGLARQLNAVFIEGDDHHPPENKAKMSSGVPLTDEDRWPWLQKLGEEMARCDGLVVASCSALRKSYREYITQHARADVLFVYLHGSRDLLAARLSERKNHFMDSALLNSQLETLEIPDESEYSITVDIDQQVQQIVSKIKDQLQK